MRKNVLSIALVGGVSTEPPQKSVSATVICHVQMIWPVRPRVELPTVCKVPTMSWDGPSPTAPSTANGNISGHQKHVSQKLYEREFVQLHSCHTKTTLLWVKLMIWAWDWHPLTLNQKWQISITGCGSRFPRLGSIIAFGCIFINHIFTNLHIKKNLHSKVPQKWRVLYHFLPGLL